MTVRERKRVQDHRSDVLKGSSRRSSCSSKEHGISEYPIEADLLLLQFMGENPRQYRNLWNMRLFPLTQKLFRSTRCWMPFAIFFKFFYDFSFKIYFSGYRSLCGYFVFCLVAVLLVFVPTGQSIVVLERVVVITKNTIQSPAVSKSAVQCTCTKNMAPFRMSTIVLVTIVALAGKLLTDESFWPSTGSFSFYKIQTQKRFKRTLIYFNTDTHLFRTLALYVAVILMIMWASCPRMSGWHNY